MEEKYDLKLIAVTGQIVEDLMALVELKRQMSELQQKISAIKITHMREAANATTTENKPKYKNADARDSYVKQKLADSDLITERKSLEYLIAKKAAEVESSKYWHKTYSTIIGIKGGL